MVGKSLSIEGGMYADTFFDIIAILLIAFIDEMYIGIEPTFNLRPFGLVFVSLGWKRAPSHNR